MQALVVVGVFCFCFFECCTLLHGICESSEPLQCVCVHPHLDYDLTASLPVCSPLPCFDTELSGSPSVSLTLIYIFFITHFQHLPVSLPNGNPDPQCLCPLSSVCFILPDFPSASLHHFLWLQNAELNISAASLSKSADYIKSSFAHSIQLQMAHPN